MKGLFIPGITAEMFRNGCLESIDALMADGEIYDIDYSPWIPVSERLPEDNTKVLVTMYTTYDEKVIIARYQDKEHGFSCGLVKAWQPLPEQYKGGK